LVRRKSHGAKQSNNKMHESVSIPSAFLVVGVEVLDTILGTWQRYFISTHFEDVVGVFTVFLFSIQMFIGLQRDKSTSQETVAVQKRNIIYIRPSWNLPFSITIKFLRSVAYSIKREVWFIRLLTDHSLPKLLLPSGVKCQKSKDPPGEWSYPSNESIESGSSSRKYILYFHGGAFCLCGPETHRDLLSRLLQATGAHIFAVKYRRPPENPFPAAIDDGLAAYLMLLRRTDPSNIIFAGDSAGGNLAITTILACESRQLPHPAGETPPSSSQYSSVLHMPFEGRDRITHFLLFSTTRSDPASAGSALLMCEVKERNRFTNDLLSLWFRSRIGRRRTSHVRSKKIWQRNPI
jgi:hypothetical protein